MSDHLSCARRCSQEIQLFPGYISLSCSLRVHNNNCINVWIRITIDNQLFLWLPCVLSCWPSLLTSDCPSDGSHEVQMDDGFFTGYRRTALQPQQILLSIHIPYSKKVEAVLLMQLLPVTFKPLQPFPVTTSCVLSVSDFVFYLQTQFVSAYKQSPRREDDISIVTAAMSVTFTPGTDVVENLRLSFGGMAPTTVLAKKTANRLIGR